MHLLILSEMWHEDSDSVAINWINHGGLAAILKHGTNITKLKTTLKLTTFEYLCCRVGSTKGTVVLVAIYRQGSQHVCERFYKKFALLLESLATYNCSLYVASDLSNIQ